jgi:hypothetical protein
MVRWAMSAVSTTPAEPLPWLFFLVAIVVAVAVGAAIGYLGLTGHLGAGIPGSKPPSSGLAIVPGLSVAVGAAAWVCQRAGR